MIERDGASVSLWQQMPLYKTKNKVSPDSTFDVAIVGAGITGVTTAFLLQQAGKRCIILESNTIGFGTTGGTTAHLNTLMDTPYQDIIKKFNQQTALLVKKAATETLRFIRSTVETLAIDCGFEETSAYMFAQDDDQVKELEEIVKGCENVQLTTRYSDDIPVPIQFVRAVEVTGQAKFHPLRYVYALAKAFEEAGGVIVQNARVLECTEAEDGLLVKTTQSNYTAGSVVYATHIPPGINLLHLRCSPWRSYAMAITLKNEEDYPSGLAYDMYDPYHYYRTQQIDGKNYLIVGGEDHKTGQEENTETQFLRLESHIRKYFDIKEITERWSSQYFEPVDGLPYIGHLPGALKNIYVATGFGGNGMTYGTIAAHLLKDILTNTKTEYSELFSPSRIKPIAGFTGFISHNADVVKEFIGKLLTKDKLKELVDIAPGEGRVVKFENQLIAVSKDLDGNIHALNPLCTHMKCTVAWNITEQSWDCPCHGARYSPSGKVITGPASKDLMLILSTDYESNHHEANVPQAHENNS